MAQHEQYLAVALAALTVLILGCWNPEALQKKNSTGQPSGHPNYLWLALFAFLVGALCCWGQNQQKRGGFNGSSGLGLGLDL
uniref:Transmembrane protein n=1 Tax=Marseillevirus LCMAC101 TaxID=2506602 RepID=A0A481YR32_9VIRU|nr:MAG: hypothetical protein LCMAC101_00270 [Marseillevirus LCMAC101]